MIPIFPKTKERSRESKEFEKLNISRKSLQLKSKIETIPKIE